jgi:anti-sigma B factor antagonist
MPERNPRVNVERVDGVMVVELADRRILDEINIAEIGDQIKALIAENDQPKIVLDFARVAHMSSSALGMLITLNKRVAERNGQLRLCNIQEAIYEVFVITRLNEIFTICQSRQEALESFE